METKICGKTWLFGDNVDTDNIIPGHFTLGMDFDEMSKHAFADLRPEFGKQRRDGEIVVAGKNFGCGSSRQVAPLVIKNRGISCIIAESFARIFLRNSINMGFPVIELPNASKLISEGDILDVKLQEGKIINQTKKQAYDIQKLPEFMERLLNDGGLNNYIRRRLKEEAQ